MKFDNLYINTVTVPRYCIGCYAFTSLLQGCRSDNCRNIITCHGVRRVLQKDFRGQEMGQTEDRPGDEGDSGEEESHAGSRGINQEREPVLEHDRRKYGREVLTVVQW